LSLLSTPLTSRWTIPLKLPNEKTFLTQMRITRKIANHAKISWEWGAQVGSADENRNLKWHVCDWGITLISIKHSFKFPEEQEILP
jgi:hypothetical protein